MDVAGPRTYDRGPATGGSVAATQAGARYRREYLLLVVDGAAAVCGDVGWVVRRGEQRVNVVARDREPEVVADEAHAAVRVGAGKLRETVELLSRLLRIPAEVRDPVVATDGDSTAAGVLVWLKRDV